MLSHYSKPFTTSHAAQFYSIVWLKELHMVMLFGFHWNMTTPSNDDGDSGYGLPTRVQPVRNDGRCGADSAANNETIDIRLLLNNTIRALSVTGMVFGTYNQTGSKKRKLFFRIYSTSILLLLLAVLGWDLGLHSSSTKLAAIPLTIWRMQATAHFVIFYAVSSSAAGYARCLEMWQAYRDNYCIAPGTAKFKSNVCASVIMILWFLYATFNVYKFVSNFDPADNDISSLVSSVINLLAALYNIFAWIASSGFMFLIAKCLADEYLLVCKQIQETSESNPHLLNQRIGDIRRRHMELSKVVKKADDIFCTHMGLSVVALLALFCFGLYLIIWDISIQGNRTVMIIRTVNVLMALAKLTSDCVSGVILHEAVSIIWIYNLR